jgi:hypothetical protein
MNIFCVDECPFEAAKLLPDRHVNKMITETNQMLSLVFSKYYHDWGTLPKKDGTVYKTENSKHLKHICTIWISKSYDNMAWAISHGFGLCDEFSYRYEKPHAGYEALKVAKDVFESKTNMSINDYDSVKSFARAMDDSIRNDRTISDVDAYRKYLNTKPWVKYNYLKDPNRKPSWIV